MMSYYRIWMKLKFSRLSMSTNVLIGMSILLFIYLKMELNTKSRVDSNINNLSSITHSTQSQFKESIQFTELREFFGLSYDEYSDVELKGLLEDHLRFDEAVAKTGNLFAIEPVTFLKHLQNPCWIGFLDESSLDGGQHGDCSLPLIKKNDKTVCETQLAIQKRLSSTWQSRIQQNKPWRLRCLPYFYIIGPPKCATTDLSWRLTRHPRIEDAGVKEYHYWSKARWDFNNTESVGRTKLLKPYVDSFDQVAERIRNFSTSQGINNVVAHDGTPHTIYHHHGPVGQSHLKLDVDYIQHIQKDKVKFITILRDPISRLYSDFFFWGNAGRFGPVKVKDHFHELCEKAINLYKDCLKQRPLKYCVYHQANNVGLGKQNMFRITLGIYHVIIQDWWKKVGKDNLLILKTELYSKDLQGSIDTILEFLALEKLNQFSTDVNRNILEQANRNVQNRKTKKELREMHTKTKTMLEEFYKDYNQELKNMLGSTYDWGY
ncbi:unnamed protein product [Owenia fusiformis]|uniref:Sulfotransferase domain-containing protein n=1 Tax=Owenia fusiformis TaxID=6347 RepID=A0A8S4NMN1_OWEFU|nr:unnamed protein product [Owenia fusiformis]